MTAKAPRTLDEALQAALREFGLDGRLRQYRALEMWDEVVGSHIAAMTTAERIDNGKLIIHVRSSTWRQELTFLKKELIARMNAALQDEIVKDIIFR